MVLASIREHGSTVLFIASTRSDQNCLANSEHVRKNNL